MFYLIYSYTKISELIWLAKYAGFNVKLLMKALLTKLTSSTSNYTSFFIFTP